MNWEAIGAIAELLGATGVIASLIYLATQIRQSREQTRSATYQQMHDQISQRVTWASQSPEIEQAVRLGIADFEQLSEEDAFRFLLWAGGVVMACENAYYQYRMGMLDEDRWQVHFNVLRATFGGSGFVQWWRSDQISGQLAPEFVALVSEILGEEAEGADRPQ
jgi:hypothetical protein